MHYRNSHSPGAPAPPQSTSLTLICPWSGRSVPHSSLYMNQGSNARACLRRITVSSCCKKIFNLQLKCGENIQLLNVLVVVFNAYLTQWCWKTRGQAATSRAQRGNVLLVFREQTTRDSGFNCSLFSVSLYHSLFMPVTTDYDGFLKLPVAVADGSLCH